MDKAQKSATIDEIAAQIEGAEAIFAVDYRGISVPQAAELRGKLREADASFRVVKNRLTKIAAERAGEERLGELLEGPTALTFVRGDTAMAAKAISTFNKEHEVLTFKGGFMDGTDLDDDRFKSIARLPSRDVLNGQFAGVVASPLTGLVRGLGSMIQGLALQLGQIAEKGLVSGEAPVPAAGPVAEESAADGEAESPSEEESQSDSSTTSQGDASPDAEQTQDEAAPVAEEAQDQAAPAAGEAKAADKGKKEVIPGADLEPIAVEPEARPLSAEEQARREAEEEERRQREAALTGDSEEPAAASPEPAKLEGDARFLATGKRKRSIARVILLPGSGQIEVNKRPLDEFFPRPLHQTMARQPLAATGYEGNVDVRVRVHGGGISGQAGAVRHGIARALTEIDPELRTELKRRGFLTRDARVKERRKAGLKKARKRPQFSKR